MFYSSKYNSPLGEITIMAIDNYLTGLQSSDINDFADFHINEIMNNKTPIFQETKEWLIIYFLV